MKLYYALASALLVAGFSSSPAAAQTFRTAVAISGSDSNPCTPAAPCRTISYALTQTSAGGELYVLSTGGYGPFTVTQAVSIIAPTGTLAAISAGSGNAITVNAGPNDLVILDGFFLDGLGTGTNGIQANSVGSLSVSGSRITGFMGQGINFTPSLGTGASLLTLTNSSIYANTGGTITVKPTNGTAGSPAARVSVVNSFFSSSPFTVDGTATPGNVSVQFNESILRYAGSIVVNGASAGSGVFTQVAINRSRIHSVPSPLVANGPTAGIVIGSSSVTSVTTLATVTNGGYIGSYGNNEMQFLASTGSLGSATLK